MTAVPPNGREILISASEKERFDIAAECGLEGINRFEAAFYISKGAGPLLAVQGQISADIRQLCGVTLEPIEAKVNAEIAVTFTLDPIKYLVAQDIDLVNEDPPEQVQDGQIDLGALAVEHLVLNLDPYPRSSQAIFDSQKWLDTGHSREDFAQPNPFAELAKLKPKP
ncbi:MAG: DUF177 domain-containing protein [Rhodospirillaceae bacterium]|nr:DUF177 domain-containing protein [Rhodospirillaceae bacterium]